MNTSFWETFFELQGAQAQAVSLRGRDAAVKAGAGSGKTRTLVARYLSLLADGIPPERLVAITFTEKAAREMRSRVRRSISELVQTIAGEERARWAELEIGINAARIGTIHSLCSEILRTHPAEAGIDPEFDVLDEGLAATLKTQCVEDTLSWAVAQPDLKWVFQQVETQSIANLLHFSLNRRPDMLSYFQSPRDHRQPTGTLAAICRSFWELPPIQNSITLLKTAVQNGSLEAAGAAFSDRVAATLAGWEAAWQTFDTDFYEAVQILLETRKSSMKLIGKSSQEYKEAFKTWIDLFNTHLYPWIKDGIDRQVETSFSEELLPMTENIIAHVISTYRSRLDERFSLDFDELEAGALRLLEIPAVCDYWQRAVEALLVDEFQDTNARQRQIIAALSGTQPGRLFVVGDDRQSIYRFRGADVTVFRKVVNEIQQNRGVVLSLDTTYRAHQPLLSATSDLLAPAMHSQLQPEPAYWVSFSPLTAYRQAARQAASPFLEFIVGRGEDAGSGRQEAASALAMHLLEMQDKGEIKAWQEAALLFRASTHFSVYETALEKAGIPFATVAGRGFYDRPEVRDVLNMLRAIADPWDDTAVAGMLRSPAFHVSLDGLYRLRFPLENSEPQPLWLALQGNLEQLDREDGVHAARCTNVIRKLNPLAERIPVGELVQELLAETDYRAILAAGHSRLWRNLDKLVEDAFHSRLTQVRAFMEFLDNLREAGAREGEAPGEMEGSVQIMTIHKAKGLEFPVVVIADASYSPRGHTSPAYLLNDENGAHHFAFNPGSEPAPLLYRYLKSLDADQEKAEEVRLLYVAATRAKEKLLICGYITRGAEHWSTSGWLKVLGEAARLDWTVIGEQPGRHLFNLPGEEMTSVWAPLVDNEKGATGRGQAPPQVTPSHLPKGKALFLPLFTGENGSGENPDEGFGWQARAALPVEVTTGLLVHRAIQYGRFSPDPTLAQFLESSALTAGLVEPELCQQAVRQAEELLARLKAHPLWLEINQAKSKQTEVQYVQGEDWGRIDLVYQRSDGWRIVEFTTDELHGEAELEEAVEFYQKQVRRYLHAARNLPGGKVLGVLCFLNYDGQILVKEIS